MTPITLDPKSTALVLIDLQNGVLGMPVAPHSAKDVTDRSAQLAAAFRQKGSPVIYVRVDISDMIHLPADAAPLRDPNGPPPPPSASELAPQSGYQPGDLVIVKRQWGAFYDTGLDQQLRRRNINTIVLTGIATNIGVESTARAAFDMGYQLVFAEDAMSSLSPESHAFAIQAIFPRMGRVRSTAELIEALA